MVLRPHTDTDVSRTRTRKLTCGRRGWDPSFNSILGFVFYNRVDRRQLFVFYHRSMGKSLQPKDQG